MNNSVVVFFVELEVIDARSAEAHAVIIFNNTDLLENSINIPVVSILFILRLKLEIKDSLKFWKVTFFLVSEVVKMLIESMLFPI